MSDETDVFVLPFAGTPHEIKAAGLDEKNFIRVMDWIPKARAYLRLIGCLDVLDERVKPYANPKGTAQLEHNEKIAELDGHIMCFVILSCEGTALALIHHMDNGVEMWKELMEQYDTNRRVTGRGL